MDKSREAFDAWLQTVPPEYYPPPASVVWQVAWTARGKHDAEVCRNEVAKNTYSECDQCINYGYIYAALAIEEQDK